MGSLASVAMKTKESGAKKTSFRLGPLPEEQLSNITHRKKEIVNAIVKRCRQIQISLGLPAEWDRWLPGTPEKTPAKPRSATKVKRGDLPNKTDGRLCRLNCVTACEIICSPDLGTNRSSTRDQQDRKAVGERHSFFTAIAKAMIDHGYKNADGTPVALITNHREDKNPEASEDLLPLLDRSSGRAYFAGHYTYEAAQAAVRLVR